jgi:hypothetical protein
MALCGNLEIPKARCGRHPAMPPFHALCAVAEAAVAATFAVHPAALQSKSRGSYVVAFARQAAMYLAHVAFSLSYSEVGRAFGRDRTTAAHACRLIEERRDDPAVDALLAALEAVCHSMRDGLGAEFDA